MGYGIMFELIEPNVCETKCSHPDCADNRHFVKNAKCNICNKQIYSGDAYYGVHLGELKHEICAYEKVNKK